VDVCIREHPATEVYVTGTFDDWARSVKLDKKGKHFEKVVELPLANEKISYKVSGISSQIRARTMDFLQPKTYHHGMA